jgi:hypothetical protein
LLILGKTVSNSSQCVTAIFTLNPVPFVSPAVIIMFIMVTLISNALEAAVEYWDAENRPGHIQ